MLGAGHYLSDGGAGRGGGLGNFLVNPSILRRPPPRQIFISKSIPQLQTVCNADPLNGPSPLLSQQIITLEIPNGFQNCYVIKHEINKKAETMTIKKGKKYIYILFQR